MVSIYYIPLRLLLDDAHIVVFYSQRGTSCVIVTVTISMFNLGTAIITPFPIHSRIRTTGIYLIQEHADRTSPQMAPMV